MLKKTVSTLLLATMGFVAANAQPSQKPKEAEVNYQFTTVKENYVTPVKNQASSGTCWSYSTISFLESEAIKKGAPKDIDLAEMLPVYMGYRDKAEKFVRMDGFLNYEQGSSFDDVLFTLKHYGMVPQAEFEGLNYGTKQNAHSEMCAGLKAYVNAINKKPNRKLTTAWLKGVEGILEAYLGEVPEKFTVDGKEYTPLTYATEYLKLNADDYVSITSFTHHPFYTQFAIEVPDNWRWGLSYNVPMEEMMQIFDYAIENGYTVAWGSDVSEKGFTRQGLATVPAPEKEAPKAGSDQQRWVGANPEEKKAEAAKEPGKEMEITQELRQIGYDEKTTTDDHGMHIYGIAKDQNGTKYYLVKNSWGETGKYKGIWYASEAFVKYKTMNIVVNKNAIPKEILKKLGL
ncbi:MAG: C1 family peptidase [Bacteroidia bacterium]|nr:C1 family peptidase [Bacteroidia bacterium]